MHIFQQQKGGRFLRHGVLTVAHLVVADARHVRRLFLDGGDVLRERGPARRNAVGRQRAGAAGGVPHDGHLELVDAHVPLLRVLRERLARVRLVVSDDVRQPQSTSARRRRR